MGDFSCAICLDLASEPVVTRCGHLFCWRCLGYWLHNPNGAFECPVCKGRVDERIPGDIIPLYGKGKCEKNDLGSRSFQRVESDNVAPRTTTCDRPSVSAYNINFAEHPRPAEEIYPRRFFSNDRNSTGFQTNSNPAEAAPHPRPNAPRAPAPPRRTRHTYSFQYNHRGGLPLTVGSYFFFFSGNLWFTLFMIFVWALYHVFASQEWRVAVRHAYQQVISTFRRSPTDANNDVTEGSTNNMGAADPSTQASSPEHSASFVHQSERVEQQQQIVELSNILIRNVILWTIFVVIVTNIVFLL